MRSSLSPRHSSYYRLEKITRRPKPSQSFLTAKILNMAAQTLRVPRAYIGVLTVIPELVDILPKTRNFCTICRNKFEAGDSLAVFGCCGLVYHLECASKWLNIPSQTPNQIQIAYVTCLPCTARWDRRVLNEFFPPANMPEHIERLAKTRSIVHVPAGIPPTGASLVEVGTYYGRLGLRVILSEVVGYGQGPLKSDELVQLLFAVMQRIGHSIPNRVMERDSA